MRRRVLKSIGYWEQECDSDFPHPADLPTCQYENDEKEKILAYLKAGIAYMGWMGFSYCRFGCDVPVNLMGSKDLTDGTWLWPQGLWHYVDSHDFRLPDEFVETMRQNDWAVHMKNIPFLTRLGPCSDECDINGSWWREWSEKMKIERPQGLRDISGEDEMPGQIIGYYCERSEKLLEDFDRTASLIKTSLIERYGEKLAGALQGEARLEFNRLIPEIPYIEGPRAGMLNSFLLISAQELAAYKAMKRHDMSPGEAWEVCHEALRLRMAEFPNWKRRLLKWFLFSRLVKKIVRKRARQPDAFCFGDFEIEYVTGSGDDFDYGVNYIGCGNYNFVREHGGEEFAPYVCMSDIALSEAMGWGLIRTQTLADGCPHCDFRFAAGAETQISSKTPEVQETIERIRRREAG